MTSLRMQFEKVDVGYCRKLSVVRERGLTAANAGGKGGGLVLEIKVNTTGLSDR